MKGKEGTIVRVGIAGQGRSGYGIHAGWLKTVENQYRVVAVADQIPERRAQAKKEFGARTYADYADLLRAGGFDLLVNALPTPLHVPGTLQALRAGYHVLCEKPMAATIKDFDRMAAAARSARRVLAPFQNNRYQPFFQKMLDVIQSGVLGDIVLIRSVWSGFSRRWDWQTFQCNLGGSLMNTGPHALDQALALFGHKRTPKVFCRMECKNELGGDADDFCSVTLHGPGMPTVEVLITAYLAYPLGQMYNVLGTRGGLTGNSDGLKWKYFKWNKAPRQPLWRRWSVDRRYPGEQLPWIEKEWTVAAEIARGRKSGYTLVSYATGVQTIYDNLHNVLTRGDRLLIPLSQVRPQIAVIEECRRQNPLPRRYRKWVPGKGPVR